MIIILGSTGMLGSTVGKYFCQKYPNVLLSYRNERVISDINKSFQFDPLRDDWRAKLDYISPYEEETWIINCIGIIKPFIDENRINSILINSLFPRWLADYCSYREYKLIHITTDCVFSGKDGNYTESSLHDCTDFYGKSKSLGEPENCMVIRTSIIGEEIHKRVSLLEWAKSQQGKEVNGFTNHLWNGITTLQYAKVCDHIIQNNLYEPQLYHVFSNAVNKYELLNLLNNKFNLDLKISPVVAKEAVNRTLSTEKEFMNNLNIPSLKEQILEL